MWRGPESGLPRGPRWLSAGLSVMTVHMMYDKYDYDDNLDVLLTMTF